MTYISSQRVVGGRNKDGIAAKNDHLADRWLTETLAQHCDFLS